MSPIFLKTSIHSCHRVFLFANCQGVAGQCQQSPVVLQVLQASWLIYVDFFFKNSPQKEVRWHKVWRLWWQKSMPKSVVIKVMQESCCDLCSMGAHPMVLRPAILFILFQQINELSDTSGQFSAVIVPSKNSGPRLVLETRCTKCQSLTLLMIFMQYVWVFPYPMFCCFGY